MRRCFVFSAGTFYGLYERPEAPDFCIAADAGRLLCEKLNITPDLVIGDFDSAPKPENAPCITVPVEKDDTDTMLAAKEGLRLGYTTFYFYGATGGARLDHTLANLQTLAYLRRHGARGYLYDQNFCYTVMENEELPLPQTVPWGLLSVFALGDRAEGVTIRGVQYPAENATIANDFPLGVSNHITEKTATVRVENGLLLVGWELPKKDGTLL